MDATTRDEVIDKLADYLHHRITLGQLVDWAEQVMMEGMEGDFAPDEYEGVREVVARLGLADVRAFGLTWEECEALAGRLEYRAQVTLHPADNSSTGLDDGK